MDRAILALSDEPLAEGLVAEGTHHGELPSDLAWQATTLRPSHHQAVRVLGSAAWVLGWSWGRFGCWLAHHRLISRFARVSKVFRAGFR